MTLRPNLTAQKKYAHSLLDQVKAGANVSPTLVRWALAILGDLAGA